MCNNRILIVEDDLIIAEDNKKILIGLGYDVTAIAVSGDDALAKITLEMPDLVLMDIKLKGEMDGTEAAARIRAEFNIPVVYVTAYADELTLQKIKQTEPYGLIVKPFETQELKGVIENAIYKHEMENKVRQSEAFFKAIVAASPHGIQLSDLDGKITFSNLAHQQILGMSEKEIVGKYVWDFVASEEGTRATQKTYKKIIEDRPKPEVYYNQNLTSDGRTIEVMINWNYITDAKGNVTGLGSFITDITDLKRANDLIKKSLHEKELLLKEIHHRVKNNLQIIHSLLNLQAQHINADAPLEMFRQSQNRVRSMALLHEQLYRSEDLAKVDFGKYIRELTNNLYRVYDIDPKKIVTQFTSEKVTLSIDLAVPCGLAVNELISNALKYAFPSDFQNKGKIEVKLHYRDDEAIELIVKDNGIGLPENFDPHESQSLGLRLVHLIVEDQLRGELHIERTQGTQFTIIFTPHV